MDNLWPWQNYIYPGCHNYNTTNIGTTPDNITSGDIVSTVNQAIYSPTDRFRKVTNNFQHTPWLPNNRNVSLNSFPIIYTLQNDPNGNVMVFSNTNPTWQANNNYHQECHFYPFQTGSDLDIYIAGEDNNEHLSITSIELEFIVPSAYTPTSDPSLSPTQAPAIPDPYCDNGIISNEVCCTLSCGLCGGVGCSGWPGGGANCCMGTIRDANNSCDTNIAPCIITSTRDPTKGMFFMKSMSIF